jgi:hypothetical protein
MRPFLIASAAVAAFLAPAASSAQDLLLRRPDDRYEAPRVPGARPGERLEVRPVPGTNSSAVYGKDGTRLGTIERKPYGGAAFYDRRGNRR